MLSGLHLDCLIQTVPLGLSHLSDRLTPFIRFTVSPSPDWATPLTKELLEKPLTTTPPESSVQRTVLTLLAVLLLVVLTFFGINLLRQSDPYVKDVLSQAGDVQRGQVMFQMNCAGCHGFDASGLVGPNLHRVASRKSRIGLIHQVTSGATPPMPQFQPSPQEMADLLEYLESL